ncbi:unnamed protein product [Cunninghamella blakesleeana]
MTKLPESFGFIELTATAFVSILTGIFISRQFTKAVKVVEDDDELDDLPQGSIDTSKYKDYKMVLVVRTNFGMTKGKIAAQCGHATLACYKAIQKSSPEVLRRWERSGQAKVALKGTSEEEILELQARALSLNLTAQSICDAGRTQIAAGSRTVLGIGPGNIYN